MVPTQLGQFHAATHVASIVLGTRVPNGCRLPCREAVVKKKKKKKKKVQVCSDGVRMGSGEFGWVWVGSEVFSHRAGPQRRQPS